MPNWELTVSLLQSLRRLRSQWSSPRPAVAPHDNSVAAIAGPQALTASQMQEAEQKQSLFDSLIVKARHLDGVECVKLWLDELVSESRDPQLALSWLPDLSSMKVTVFLHIKLQSNEKDSHSIEVEVLADNKVVVKNGTTTVELIVDKERLCRCVRQQILIHQLDVARKEAQNCGWETLQYNPYCLAVVPGNDQVYGRYNTEASVIVIETSDASIKLCLSLEWGSCKVELTQYSQADHSSSNDHRKAVVKNFELDHQFGSCFKEKFTKLLTWTRSNRISF